jgi:hypothetical protein
VVLPLTVYLNPKARKLQRKCARNRNSSEEKKILQPHSDHLQICTPRVLPSSAAVKPACHHFRIETRCARSQRPDTMEVNQEEVGFRLCDASDEVSASCTTVPIRALQF